MSCERRDVFIDYYARGQRIYSSAITSHHVWRSVWWRTCEVQGGGVASLRVAAVNVVWAAQLLHSRQAAFLGCVQQGGVSTQQVLDVGVSVFDQVQRRVPVSVLLGGVGTVLGEGRSKWRWKSFDFIHFVHKR